MMNKLSPAFLALLPLAASVPAPAADVPACKLRGGSVVPLPAEACAKEGGTALAGAPAAKGVPAASAPAAAYPLSADARLAAAQQAVLVLLNKPVVGEAKRQSDAEGIVRQARFAECKLQVEEAVRLDYGNFVADRKLFQIRSAVDFRALKQDAFGVLGKVASKGGALKTQAVYLEMPRRSGDYLAISVSVQSGGGFRKLDAPGPAPHWDAPRDDLWLADEYGYVKVNANGNFVTGTVRVLYLFDQADDAAALKQAFADLAAACQPQH